MEQKFIKVGSSTGAVIPKEVAERQGIHPGVKFTLTTEEGSNRIIIEPSQVKEQEKIVDPSVVQWADEFITKNRELLERLKGK